MILQFSLFTRGDLSFSPAIRGSLVKPSSDPLWAGGNAVFLQLGRGESCPINEL